MAWIMAFTLSKYGLPSSERAFCIPLRLRPADSARRLTPNTRPTVRKDDSSAAVSPFWAYSSNRTVRYSSISSGCVRRYSSSTSPTVLYSLMVRILPPIGLRLVNIPWLTVLISAAEQDHDRVAVLAEIHPVPRAEKQP